MGLKIKKCEQDFIVQCNVCGQIYKNWSGSTPCCGSLAFIVEEEIKTNKVVLYQLEYV